MALIFKSIDTMKATRDSGSFTNAQKIEHINALVTQIPDLTHIPVCCYADNPGYQSVAYVKEWFDAVHTAGKKVFFRPGLTSATTTGTNAQRITNFQTIVTNLSACWANGDAWDVWPEVGVAALGTQAQYNQWIRDVIPALQTSFTGISKTVDCTFFSMIDQLWIFGNAIEAATVTAMGNKLCIDFYPMDYIGSPGHGSAVQKVNNFIGQLRLGHANYPTADIYVTETGYNSGTEVGDEDQREVLRVLFNALSGLSYVKGFNYWCGYGSSYDSTRLYQSSSRTLPRPAVKMLSEYFSKGACTGRMDVL